MDPHLQRAHEALQQSAGGLTLEQLTARPPGKWNIAEILEHLARTYAGTATGAGRVVASGTPSRRHRSGQTGQADLIQRVRAFVVVECGYLPTGVKSPKMVVPIGIDPATALSVAMDSLRSMDAALAEAASHFGAGVKLMDHPIIGPLSVRQWRKFHWVHTRHHVRQIVGRSRVGTLPRPTIISL